MAHGDKKKNLSVRVFFSARVASMMQMHSVHDANIYCLIRHLSEFFFRSQEDLVYPDNLSQFPSRNGDLITCDYCVDRQDDSIRSSLRYTQFGKELLLFSIS